MKALNVVAIVTFLLAIFAGTTASTAYSAQTDSTVVTQTVNEDELFERLETSLLFGLESDVVGVVESSIFNAVNFKAAYPEFTSEKVMAELRRVALEGDNHTLRYKAYLAFSYYQNPAEFDSPEAVLSVIDNRHKDGIFFYLQEIVHSEQFTSN